MTQWNSYHKLSRLGIAGMVAGALVAAWSFQQFRRPAPPALPAATAGDEGHPDVTP